MDDAKAQEEELEALESIFTPSELTISKNDKEISGYINILLELPDNYKVIGDAVHSKFKSSDEYFHLDYTEFTVKNLPPVVLSFKFPLNYPSEEKPDFKISCKWLTLNKLSKLCLELDKIWEETKGTVVLFEWIQFIKEETLKICKCEKRLDITAIRKKQELFIRNEKLINELKELKKNSKEGESSISDLKKPFNSAKVINNSRNLYIDPRAFFDLNKTDSIILRLKNFDLEQQQIIFDKSFATCSCCFNSKLGSLCIQFQPCLHVFCKECTKGYFQIQIKDRNLHSLKCLEHLCDTQATPNQVKSVVSEEMFHVYDEGLLNSALEQLHDIIYCPRVKCQYPVSIESNEELGRCPQCTYVFCIFCKMTYHGVDPCRLKSEEHKKLFDEYTTGTTEQKSFLEKKYGKKQLQKIVDTLLSETWTLNNAKKCPRCNTDIEKSSGCNKIACSKCGSYFCWLCLDLLPKADPYLHYRRLGSKCANRLFEGTEIDDDDDEDDLFWGEEFFHQLMAGLDAIV